MSTSEPPNAFARQGTNTNGFGRQSTKSFARQGTSTAAWGTPAVIKSKGRNTENMTEEIKSEIRRVVPVLSESKYKGQSGKVAVLGGCLEYSSAAYFVAAAALRAGADLSHVFCSDLAAQVIKGYSPDIAVHPYLRESPPGITLPHEQLAEQAEAAAAEVEAWFTRLDCLVVGPGISRDPLMLETARRVMLKARMANLPLVLDGDALFLVASEPELVRGYANCILTPNLTEYRRLAAILGVSLQVPGADRSSKLQEACGQLGGPTIVSKGPVDAICDGSVAILCSTSSANRRIGHLGHILAGCLGTLLAWTQNFIDAASHGEEIVLPEFNPMLLAAYGGCMLTRSATAYAYSQSKRSMVPSDVLLHVGHAVDSLLESALASNSDAPDASKQ